VEKNFLALPIQIATKIDVGRLLRELEGVDNFLEQAAIRQPGTSVKLPKTSRLADEFVESNKINLLRDEDRRRAINFLIMVKAKAPVLHMSFSADPSPIFQQKLVTWLRNQIHPLALLQVGLQPNIGAGCVLRTTNKYFDFSLREHFRNNRDLLIETIHGQETPKQVAAAPVAPEGAAA
jgi:hypothetical protein